MEDLILTLKSKYNKENIPLYKNYVFKKWLIKSDGSENFQFKFLSNQKSIPFIWLIESEEVKVKGQLLDRDWFRKRFGVDDCRASVAIWLIKNL